MQKTKTDKKLSEPKKKIAENTAWKLSRFFFVNYCFQSHPKNLENYGCVEMERKKNSVFLKNSFFFFFLLNFFHIPKFGLKKSELK